MKMYCEKIFRREKKAENRFLNASVVAQSERKYEALISWTYEHIWRQTLIRLEKNYGLKSLAWSQGGNENR